MCLLVGLLSTSGEITVNETTESTSVKLAGKFEKTVLKKTNYTFVKSWFCLSYGWFVIISQLSIKNFDR